MAHSSLFEKFAQIAKTYPSQPAIFFKQDNQYQALTYQELYNRAIKLGGLLYEQGIKETDHIAILFGNQPEWPISFLSVQYLGAVAVAIDIKLNPQEIRQLVLHSQAKAILCPEKLYLDIKEYTGGIKSIIIDSPAFFDSLNAPSLETIKGKEAVLTEDRPAAMFYTSGTTDSPKAVLLSQKNLLSNLQAITQLNIAASEDVFISLLPLHHTYSFMVTCLFPLSLGAQISYPSGLSSEEILACLRNTKVTILVAVPQLFSLFHQSIKEKLKKLPLIVKITLNILKEGAWLMRKYLGINFNKVIFSKLHQAFGRQLRFMITGGARLEPKVTQEFFKWGFTILEGYGLTETSPVATFNSPQKLKFGSAGKPITNVQVKIDNPDNQGIGEVAIKGPNVMLGYYQLPQETEKVIKEGWFFTGDLGYLDKEGYLYITGRKDELIVLSSGKKVNPEEIEKHYSLSPFIKEICVFTAQGAGFLEGAKQLMAIIVPNENYFRSRNIVNIEERIKWELDNLTQRLSNFKRLSGFLISKELLPRTALGKIVRHKIEKIYLEKLAQTERSEEPLSQEDLVLLSSQAYIKILHYLSQRLKRKVNLNDHLELDLGVDSLGRIEILLELQQMLGIEIPESLEMELFYANTVKDMFLKIKPFLPKEIKSFSEDKFQWSQILEQKPPISILETMRLKPLLTDKIIAFFFMGFFKILFKAFFLLEVKNRSNLPEKGPYIIYANHSSYLDGFIIASCLPFRLNLKSYFVGFKAYFLHPLIKNTVKTARLVPIDIALDLVEAMQACAYLLKNSKIICFYPEGQRTIDGQVKEFKKGIGILAKELNIPLVPAYIEGAFQAWPRYKWFPRLAKIRVAFGKKLTYTDLTINSESKLNTYESVAESLRQELLNLTLKSPV